MAKKVIKISKLTPEAVNKAIEEIREYRRDLQTKVAELTRRLAEVGVQAIRVTMAGVDGETAGSWSTGYETISEDEEVYTVRYVLSGEKVAFVEFSAGITHGIPGAAYPLDAGKEFGYGTYNPDSDNWKNPKGWVYIGDDGLPHRTWGNPAYEPVYHSTEAVKQKVGEIVREVFS